MTGRQPDRRNRPASTLAGCLLVALFAAFVLAPRAALAQTCSVSSTAMAFGTFSSQVTFPALTTTASITVTCNPGLLALLVTYTVAAQFGTGGGGTFATRRMTGTNVAANRLGYQLYLDSGYSQVFGDGTSGTSVISDNYLLVVGTPVVRKYTVYGRVPAGADKPDIYHDPLSALLSYSGVVVDNDVPTESAFAAASAAADAAVLPPRGRRRRVGIRRSRRRSRPGCQPGRKSGTDR